VHAHTFFHQWRGMLYYMSPYGNFRGLKDAVILK